MTLQLSECLDVVALRARVDDQLNRLSGALMSMMRNTANSKGPVPSNVEETGAAATALQKRIALLGQLAAGLAMVEADAVPNTGAGYGSIVIGEELFSGRRHQYTLMLGSLIDIDAGQVSLASPIGQALFGREVGEIVEIALPHRRLRLRIVSVRTIGDLLENLELVYADET